MTGALSAVQKQQKAIWILDNGPCQRCGSWDEPTIDHIIPGTQSPRLKREGKEYKGTNRIWSWSVVLRNEELRKCQVLCLTCHRAKSHGENVGDPLEWKRRVEDLRRKRQVLDAQARSKWLLALPAKPAPMTQQVRYALSPLPPEQEERINAILAKYGFDREEDDDDDGIVIPEEPALPANPDSTPVQAGQADERGLAEAGSEDAGRRGVDVDRVGPGDALPSDLEWLKGLIRRPGQ